MKKRQKDSLVISLVIFLLALTLFFGVRQAVLTNDTQYGVFRDQTEGFECEGARINLEYGLTLMREGKCEQGYDFFKEELKSKFPDASANAWQQRCINKGLGLRNVLNNYYCSGASYDDKVELDPQEREEAVEEVEEEVEEEAQEEEIVEETEEIIEEETQEEDTPPPKRISPLVYILPIIILILLLYIVVRLIKK